MVAGGFAFLFADYFFKECNEGSAQMQVMCGEFKESEGFIAN